VIVYRLRFASGQRIRIEIDPDVFEEAAIPAPRRPEWSRLDYHQCTHCPLDPDEVSHCPAALGLARVLPEFEDNISYEHVDVLVETPQRTYRKRTDAQTALGSLMGLCMATSPCPVLEPLRSMAEFHLPFATAHETIFRTVATYLLRQYFVHRDGGDPDLGLEGLAELYDDLETLNQCFAERIRAAADKDAHLNAVVILSTLSARVSMSLDHDLKMLRRLFGDE